MEGEGRNQRRKEGRREEENQRRIGNGGNGKKEEIDWVRSWFGECNNKTDLIGGEVFT